MRFSSSVGILGLLGVLASMPAGPAAAQSAPRLHAAIETNVVSVVGENVRTAGVQVLRGGVVVATGLPLPAQPGEIP